MAFSVMSYYEHSVSNVEGYIINSSTMHLLIAWSQALEIT